VGIRRVRRCVIQEKELGEKTRRERDKGREIWIEKKEGRDGNRHGMDDLGKGKEKDKERQGTESRGSDLVRSKEKRKKQK